MYKKRVFVYARCRVPGVQDLESVSIQFKAN